MNKEMFYKIGAIGIIQFIILSIIFKLTRFDLLFYIQENTTLPYFINFLLGITYLVFLGITWYFAFAMLIHFWKNSKLNFLFKLIIIVISMFLHLAPVIYYYLKKVK